MIVGHVREPLEKDMVLSLDLNDFKTKTRLIREHIYEDREMVSFLSL